MKKKFAKKLTKKTRQQISKGLRRYWESFEGKRRRHEFFKIPKGKLKQFRKKEEEFSSKQKGEYAVDLYQRQPKGGYKKVPLTSFKRGQKYHVYIRHKKTKRSRLLASGRLHEIPVATLKQTKNWFQPVIGSSRKFNPLVFKKKGKWVPISKFYSKATANIEEQAKIRRMQNYKVRGAILPLKRFYNPELMIFSDEPIPRSRRVKEVFAHVVTAYDYPNIRWISARHVKVEFKQGIRLEDLHKKLEQIEDLAEDALQIEHPKAGIKALMIDGFIPVKFGEPYKRDKDARRKTKKKSRRK